MKLEFGTGSRFSRFKLDKAKSLVNHALSKGIRRFDTGYTYGNYKSQPLLAKCLEKKILNSREEISISTKTPSYSPEIIEECVKTSLGIFKSSYLDKLYLWGPNEKDLENKKIFETAKKLIDSGLIKEILINTHSLSLIKKISTGYYDEISGIMLDYNLLQQDRYPYIKKSKKNGLSIIAGTVFCQGLLIESPTEIILRTLSPFYLGRMLLKKSSRRYIQPSKKLRSFCRKNYTTDIQKKLPLSFIVNENLIDSIPIGMMSINSINKNIEVYNNKLDTKITNKVSGWALKNCQIKDKE